MPIYEYRCPSCGHEEDRLVSMNGRDGQVCGQEVATNVELTGFEHMRCGGHLERTEIASVQTNLVDKRWQYKAILGDGQRVPGSFGMGRPRNHRGFM